VPLDDHNTTRYGSDTYTLYEIFENGRKKGGDYLGYRKNGEGPYIFYTYGNIWINKKYFKKKKKKKKKKIFFLSN